jgi:hypothetical protein
MDLVVHLFKTTASQAKSPTDILGPAKRRLTSILNQNPQMARRLAWHAAQIVAVANEFLVSAPCEIMRVLMGYIFILAFTKYGPKPWNDLQLGHPPIQLDFPRYLRGHGNALITWIETGGHASIGTVHDIYAPGGLQAISQEAQAMLGRVRCWGLAKKFIRVLDNCDLTKG